jgi:osmotically-inducible protein OsmY
MKQPMTASWITLPKTSINPPRPLPVLLTMAVSALMLTGSPLKASEADDRIEASAKHSYIFRTFLNEESITTESKDGIVTLNGTVNNESQRMLAQETVASLPGVKSVVNKIEVRPSPEGAPSDTMLFLKVKNTLAFHRSVSAMHTKVELKEGVVTLRGEAANLAQKELTAEYILDVNGVKNVINEMTVAAAPPPITETLSEFIDDASITAQVRMALWSHRSTSLLKVTVAATEGNVVLGGIVHNLAEKDLVTKLVTDIVGVKSVTNNMTFAIASAGQ